MGRADGGSDDGNRESRTDDNQAPDVGQTSNWTCSTSSARELYFKTTSEVCEKGFYQFEFENGFDRMYV